MSDAFHQQWYTLVEGQAYLSSDANDIDLI